MFSVLHAIFCLFVSSGFRKWNGPRLCAILKLHAEEVNAGCILE